MRRFNPLTLVIGLAVLIFSLSSGIKSLFSQSSENDRGRQVTWDEVLRVKVPWPESEEGGTVTVTTVNGEFEPSSVVDGVPQAPAGCNFIYLDYSGMTCDSTVEEVRVRVLPGARVFRMSVVFSVHPNDRQMLELLAFPTGITTAYVANEGTASAVTCRALTVYSWTCQLPIGTFVLSPPIRLTRIWGMIRDHSPMPLYSTAPAVFDAELTSPSGNKVPVICDVVNRAEATDAWDFACDVSGGMFVVNFDPGGFQLRDPSEIVPGPSDSLMPTVTPQPGQ